MKRIKLSPSKYGLLFLVPFVFWPLSPLSAQPLSGQIIVDPNRPEWLVYNRDADSDGDLDPYFLSGPGDPEDFLYRGSRNADGTRSGDQQSIINKLKSSGANSIYMQAVRSNGGDGGPDHNPFIGSDKDNGVDANILNQWETWFSEMDGSGITIFLFFYDDAINVSSNLGWPLDGSGNLHPGEQNFIETVVNRFEHHKHLIWVVMEEVQEMGSDYIAHAKKIAEVVRGADDYDHVIAVHKLTGLSFSEFADDANIDQFAIQYGPSNASQMHSGMVAAWNNAAGRYNLNMSESPLHKGKTGAALREVHWAAALGGAYVMAIEVDVASTPQSDLTDLGRLRSFMESTDFNKMAPHDELAFADTQYVLANPGSSYIAYAKNASGSIGLKGMTAGSYDFSWFDIASGTIITQSSIAVLAGDAAWARPSGVGPEAALYVRRAAVNDSAPDSPKKLRLR